MSRYTHKRVVFVDSSQRVSGASDRWPHDFYVDLDSVVTREHPMFGARDPDVKIYASISQLYVPLPKNSKGVLDRDPIYTEGDVLDGTKHTPRVNLLRLHTNLAHNNGDASGYSSVVLQAPFLPHYYEADQNNPHAHAAFSYEEPHPESTGTFELVNGTHSLGLVHFFLTDENNRRVRTLSRGVIHIAMTLKTESTVRKRKYNEETSGIMREMLALARLSLLQNDVISRKQMLTALTAMQEQTDEEGAEGEEGGAGNHREKKGRKFLASEQEREEELRNADFVRFDYDYETGPRRQTGGAASETDEGEDDNTR